MAFFQLADTRYIRQDKHQTELGSSRNNLASLVRPVIASTLRELIQSPFHVNRAVQ